MLFQKSVKIGDLLRNRSTREIWLAVHKTTQGIFVVNLMLKNDPAVIHMILPAHTSNWDRDTDIDDLDRWEKEAIERKADIIESVSEILE